MNELDYAWAAGFFDGEGCIQIRRMSSQNGNRLNLLLAIGQVYPEPLLKMQELFGGSISKSKTKHYRLDIAAKKGEEALRKMLPYLVLKKTQAELAIKFREKIPKQGSKHTPEAVWEELYTIRDLVTADKYRERI